MLNEQMSERTELDLRDAENRIAALDSQKVLLQSQLAQINPTMQVFSDTGQRVLSPEDRLTTLKSQLAEYKARYAPGHPDIVATEREVAGLEKQVNADDRHRRSRATARGCAGAAGPGPAKIRPDHPDVVRLTHLVEELEKDVVAQPASGVRGGSARTPTIPPTSRSGQLDR